MNPFITSVNQNFERETKIVVIAEEFGAGEAFSFIPSLYQQGRAF